MNIMRKISIRNFALLICVMALMMVMTACGHSDQTDRSDQTEKPGQTAQTDRTVDSDKNRAAAERTGQDQNPLLHVREFDRFTLRANVSPAEVLSDALARQYGIDPESDLVLLNVVVLENQSNGKLETVSARVTAHHQSLTSRVENIDMRSVEANGYVSYIGTMDVSDQRKFPLVIEVLPTGADQPLRMDFEVQLEAFGDDDQE